MGPYDMTLEARIAFRRLKAAFAAIPVLQHFDSAKLIYLEIDASGFAIAGILSQLGTQTEGQRMDMHWYPVAFWS